MLTIAHRLATTDQIIVLNDHKIAEFGTHGELLSNSGVICANSPSTIWTAAVNYYLPPDSSTGQPERRSHSILNLTELGHTN